MADAVVETEEPKTLNGKKVKDIKVHCSKHGDISQGSIYLRYTTVSEKEGKRIITNNNNLICTCCLNEMYTRFQNEDLTQDVISYKKDDSGKLVLDEEGNPIQIVEKRIVYLKDEEGNLILDENGNPIPEKQVGKISVEVVYDEEEDAKDSVGTEAKPSEENK